MTDRIKLKANGSFVTVDLNAEIAVRPILLDLFCKAGGAAQGYHQAGFDIVGVDVGAHRWREEEDVAFKRDGLKFPGTDAWREGMGIDWMTGNELAEAIPPAFTRYIGVRLIEAMGVGAPLPYRYFAGEP